MVVEETGEQPDEQAEQWMQGPNTVVHNNNKVKLKAQDKHGNKVPGVVHASNVVVEGEQPTGGQCARHGH